jgi:molybdenum cofactor guanylyltransferase
MTVHHNITALILAGGQGRRMHEADKGLQLLHGKPLVAHVLARIAPQVNAALISANRNIERYAVYASVLADQHAGFAGPLAGMHAGLAACTTPWMVCAPCDMPYLPLDMVARLHEAMHTCGAAASYAVVDGQAHFTCCLVQAAVQSPLTAFLQQGQRKVQDFLRSVDAVACTFTDSQGFTNVNDAVALQRLQQTAV